MQRAAQPARFLIPTAQNDTSKAEIPATTPDDSRASQSLGFPPRTGLPPEAGGVPPQLPDMNGLLNQATRVPFWHMLGGRYGYDSTFANDPAIGGHPLGAVLPSADGSGEFYSTVNDNTANPDTSGAGWVPGYHYGSTALAVTGGNVTLSPAQAAKTYITLLGTLTSNVVIVVPAWLYEWTFINNTSGAFSATVKTATGSGASLAQNGAPSVVRCDGANCSLFAPNVGAATSDTQAMQLGQASGRILNIVRFIASGTYTPSPNAKSIIVELQGGGGGGGGGGSTSAGESKAGAGGGGGGFVRFLLPNPTSQPVTIGTGGAGGAANITTPGSSGLESSFGVIAAATGGGGGSTTQLTGAFSTVLPGGVGGKATVLSGVEVLNVGEGARGGTAFAFSSVTVLAGTGGSTSSGATDRLNVAAAPPENTGTGGCGCAIPSNTPTGSVGGRGSDGCCIVYEYS